MNIKMTLWVKIVLYHVKIIILEHIIGDFNNVKVLVDKITVNAYNYQTWSLFTYLQEKKEELNFHSKNSKNCKLDSRELPSNYGG